MPIFDHNHPKTSNNEHDRNPIKDINVLSHNRTQKQLQYVSFIYFKNSTNFIFWILWICLATFIKNDNLTCTSFDVYLHAKNELHS